MGGEPIPKNSDMVFDLEVVDCNRVPDHNTVPEALAQPRTTTMKPN